MVFVWKVIILFIYSVFSPIVSLFNLITDVTRENALGEKKLLDFFIMNLLGENLQFGLQIHNPIYEASNDFRQNMIMQWCSAHGVPMIYSAPELGREGGRKIEMEVRIRLFLFLVHRGEKLE